MSNSKRRSTVHDLTSLRLHPDGSKVVNSASNLQLRKARNATKDARGNWIAQDAGGLGRIQTRRSAKKDQAAEAADEGEDEDKNGDNDNSQAAAGASSLTSDKGKGKAIETAYDANDEEFVPKDVRAKKRRIFANDFQFLGSPAGNAFDSRAPSGSVVAVQDSDRKSIKYAALSQPSSDLLKCIHYFASTYYSEMGQLRDSSREYRRKKKRRKLAKLNAVSADSGSLKNERYPTHSEEGSFVSSASEDDSEKEGDKHEKQPRKHKTEGGRSKSEYANAAKGAVRSRTDMYKVCDGSALMAIGMLLQHHVADLLTPRIPDGWEEAMVEYGEVPLHVEGQRIQTVQNAVTDDEEEAELSGKSGDETEDDALIDRINDGLEDEEYVPG